MKYDVENISPEDLALSKEELIIKILEKDATKEQIYYYTYILNEKEKNKSKDKQKSMHK